MSHWDCKGHSLTWKVLAIKPYHILFQLQGSVLSTEENESGLLLIQEEMENQSLEENQESLNNLNKLHSFEMWPTPTTKGYGHASEGQVANLLKKVQEGEITMKQAEQMVGLKTLINHRTYKKLWPTPRASELMHQKLTPKLAQRASDYGNLEEAVATKPPFTLPIPPLDSPLGSQLRSTSWILSM